MLARSMYLYDVPNTGWVGEEIAFIVVGNGEPATRSQSIVGAEWIYMLFWDYPTRGVMTAVRMRGALQRPTSRMQNSKPAGAILKFEIVQLIAAGNPVLISICKFGPTIATWTHRNWFILSIFQVFNKSHFWHNRKDSVNSQSRRPHRESNYGTNADMNNISTSKTDFLRHRSRCWNMVHHGLYSLLIGHRTAANEGRMSGFRYQPEYFWS